MTSTEQTRATFLHPEGPTIEIVPTATALDDRAAEHITVAIAAGNAATITLPTGSTPIGLYHILCERIGSGALSLEGVVVFQLDEFRNLPADHPQSFAVWLRGQLLDAAGVGIDRFHLVPATANDPVAAGIAFETLIDRAGGLDLAVLGLGDNGHVAFNEPGSAVDSRTRLLTLSDETIAQTGRTWPPDSPVPTEAVTMGVGTLLEARSILLLVKGVAKAGIARKTLLDELTADVPGSFMRRAGSRLTVVLDEPAASGIQDELTMWERIANRD